MSRSGADGKRGERAVARRQRNPAKASNRRAKRKADVLEGKLKPKQTAPEANAALLVAGLGSNAAAAWSWSEFPFGEVKNTVDLTSTLNGIVEASERVNRGDLGDMEALLTAQTVTLNAIFVNLAYKANKMQRIDHFESFLKLALKAQSQCRTTCEALAELKRPPVFTKQANIASRQVVNNGTMVAGSRARETLSEQNELLEVNGERLDCGAPEKAGPGHPTVAAVGGIDRTTNGGREGPVVTKRRPRRSKEPATQTRKAVGAARNSNVRLSD